MPDTDFRCNKSVFLTGKDEKEGDCDMKKIGILTFHAVSDCGAVLQAYALQNIVESFWVECEIINYQNTTMRSQYMPIVSTLKNISHPRIFLKNLFMIPVNTKRNGLFASFRNQYLRIETEQWSEKRLPTELLYDAVIAGSDQVWNLNCNGNGINYFLRFVPDTCKKYSYAAGLSTNDFTRELDAIYNECLDNYCSISVREESSSIYLKELLDREVTYPWTRLFTW